METITYTDHNPGLENPILLNPLLSCVSCEARAGRRWLVCRAPSGHHILVTGGVEEDCAAELGTGMFSLSDAGTGRQDGYISTQCGYML